MIMTDLRGFTSLSERLPPERVVAICSTAISPPWSRSSSNIRAPSMNSSAMRSSSCSGPRCGRRTTPQRAVACAVAMQIGDGGRQRQNRDRRPARARDGHRRPHRPGGGRQYRLGRADEIRRGRKQRQSYLAHPVLHHRRTDPVSEATRQEVGAALKIGKQMEVRAKGIEHPVKLSEVLGIGRPYQLLPYRRRPTLSSQLTEEIPIAIELFGRQPSLTASLCSGVLHQGVAQGGRGPSREPGARL